MDGQDERSRYVDLAFEHLDHGIAVFGRDLTLVAHNAVFLTQLSLPPSRAKTGVSLTELHAYMAQRGDFGPGKPETQADLRDNFEALTDLFREEVVFPPNSLRIMIHRMALPDGGLIMSLNNFTTEFETQEQLRQISKMDALGRLTGGVAHDFNNVLAIIQGNLELVIDRSTNEEDKRSLKTAIAAAQRGAELTHRLLAFARKQALSPLVTKPGIILNDLTPMLRVLLGEMIDVELVCDAGAWAIEIDRSQLENVIVNIAINARDAMPEGGKLTIEATNTRVDDYYARLAEIERGQYVCIACTDTGRGMEKSIADKVFEPFFTTKDAAMGTGLGLSMAHGFVKQSGGHIKIYSEPGEGTTVKIYLPRASGSGDHIVVEEPVELGAVSTETRILVVEDDDLLRGTIQQQLVAAGFNVHVAADYDSALQALLAMNGADILLTDVVLPGAMNGKKLAEAVQTLHPDMKVIFMSGYSENAIIHHGRLDEGVTLIQKPFRTVDLLREIAKASA